MSRNLANPPHTISSIKCMFYAATVGLADQIPEKATDDARDFLTKCFTLDPEVRLRPPCPTPRPPPASSPPPPPLSCRDAA